ncbi:MAG TPA: TonB family protein [Acidobacteriota bacterium]|nr:TonB family protein [Acidobacteriota bacterium]
MSSDEKKAVLTKADENYESTVLDFLEKEISASAKPVPEQNVQSDDVDVLVSDLLKLALAVTEEQESPQETKPEDLDKLFADILSGRTDTSLPKSQVPAADPKQNQGNVAAALPERESPRPPAVRETKVEAATPPRPMRAPTAHETALTSSPAAPAKVAVKEHPVTNSAASVPSVKDSLPVFMPTSVGPSRKWRIVSAGAGFACLLGLIGAGAYHFIGTRSTKPPAQSKSVSLPVPAASPTKTVEVPQQVAGGSKTVARESTPPRSTPAVERSAQTASASRSKAPGPAPAPVREEKAPAAKATEPRSESAPPQPTAIAEVTVPVASLERPAEAVATDDSPAAVPKTEVPEEPAPPATIIAQSTPVWNAGGPAPAVLPSAATIASFTKPGGQPPAPSKIKAAVLTSQVRPVYPDVARRMRLTGVVRLDIQIDERGKVVKATPVSGPPLLQGAAVEAVMKWRYRPATIGDTEVRSQGQVSVVFNNP